MKNLQTRRNRALAPISVLAALSLAVAPSLSNTGETFALWQDWDQIELGTLQLGGGGFGEDDVPTCWNAPNSHMNGPVVPKPITANLAPDEVAVVSIDLRDIRLTGSSANQLRLQVSIGTSENVLLEAVGSRSGNPNDPWAAQTAFTTIKYIIIAPSEDMAEALRNAGEERDIFVFESGNTSLYFHYYTQGTQGNVGNQPYTFGTIGWANFNKDGLVPGTTNDFNVVTPGIGTNSNAGGATVWTKINLSSCRGQDPDTIRSFDPDAIDLPDLSQFTPQTGGDDEEESDDLDDTTEGGDGPDPEETEEPDATDPEEGNEGASTPDVAEPGGEIDTEPSEPDTADDADPADEADDSEQYQSIVALPGVWEDDFLDIWIDVTDGVEVDVEDGSDEVELLTDEDELEANDSNDAAAEETVVVHEFPHDNGRVFAEVNDRMHQVSIHEEAGEFTLVDEDGEELRLRTDPTNRRIVFLLDRQERELEVTLDARGWPTKVTVVDNSEAEAARIAAEEAARVAAEQEATRIAAEKAAAEVAARIAAEQEAARVAAEQAAAAEAARIAAEQEAARIAAEKAAAEAARMTEMSMSAGYGDY